MGELDKTSKNYKRVKRIFIYGLLLFIGGTIWGAFKLAHPFGIAYCGVLVMTLAVAAIAFRD